MALGVRVKVLADGVYNDPNHRALPHAERNDEIVVASGDYLNSLVDEKLVKVIEDEAPHGHFGPSTATTYNPQYGHEVTGSSKQTPDRRRTTNEVVAPVEEKGNEAKKK